MDARIAVAVGHVEVAVRRDGEVRRSIERWSASRDRADGLPVIARVGRHAARSDGLQEAAVARESTHGLIAVVREPQRVVGRERDPVRAHREDALAPRADETAVALVDEHGVRAAGRMVARACVECASVTTRRGQGLYDRLVGVYTIFLTPFTSNGELDLDAAAENADYLIREGMRGIVV